MSSELHPLTWITLKKFTVRPRIGTSRWYASKRHIPAWAQYYKHQTSDGGLPDGGLPDGGQPNIFS